MVRRGVVAVLVVMGMMLGLLTSCGKGPAPAPTPPLNLPVADDTVAALASALGALDVRQAPLASSPTTAQTEIDTIVSGMDGLKPKVTPAGIAYAKDEPRATATLHYEWAMPSGTWAYDVTGPLEHNGQGWKAVWSPALLNPRLDATNRLVHTRTPAKRAPITGNNGVALVEEHEVVKVGIDKTRVTPEQAAASARALAGVVGINPDTYAASVTAGGAKAFVVAVTLRKEDVPPQVASIPGALGVAGTAMLTATPGFADELLGSIGEATPEVAAASKGAVAAGDMVGLTGLQKRYDEQLRGTPGDKITLVGRRPASPSPSPSGSSSPPATPPGSAPPSPTTQPSVVPQVLHEGAPVAGQPLAISLDLELQQKAERVMQTVPGAAAAAIVRPSSGAILAVANSPGSNGQPDASFGQYAPGSTFKVATALALLRKGYTPDTMVSCTATTTVEGWPFKNYADFPSSRVGTIPLKDAIASSCNTALINEYAKVSGDDLRNAAASLGVGVDYDAGFPVFYGTVPAPDSGPKKAQEMIGQGGVLASPVSMAGLASSVAADKTVVPWLVDTKRPQPSGPPLTPVEGAALRTMLGYTVEAGSGQVLKNVALGAKTGTAEYGLTPPLPTHAWMICYTAGDYAVAVWVKDGESGSRTAAPVILALMS